LYLVFSAFLFYGVKAFFETKVANKNELRGEWCNKNYSKRFFLPVTDLEEEGTQQIFLEKE